MPTRPVVSERSLKCAVAATIGSLLIAYGLREFLRATGGGYYCCNHLWYQGQGAILTFAGWLILMLAWAEFSDQYSVK